MADQQINLVDHTTNGANTPSTQPERQASPDSHVEVLYENQRGWFVFGIPLFSHKALWNLRIDPAPWQDVKFRPSAVNITNAQVPDPSWVWDWKSWYVDMSLDVDEEGWQYSFLFKGSPWHGNHPWFHSFVRRRRWLRRRVKQKLPPKTKANARERMFGETFSIGTTLARSTTFGTGSGLLDSTQVSLDEEIGNIPTLMKKLKAAAIDREKIIYIHKFIDDGGEELHYLAEQIPAIMSMLIFQNSRRQLLSTLMDRFEAAKDHREQHEKDHKPEGDAEQRRINNLLKAIEAADNECKKLEYWSDIKNLTEEGKAGNATDPSMGWDEKWQGIDVSGAKHPEC
ncbi:hypothetical protein PtrSN002B_004140 [Pyrenophora tritici-repentis]|uniref:Pex24p domain containing protein n=2 Tax=Pyrenophora tritici-repentis TaxID=45151 RepID=A0A2W1E6C3_9PLEO|nr:uncharacterized protein PTRG_00257 [Pyrenophora tritici-repentis Pt-1C-BFP]KAA8624844.1 hypothetical protein PtrV1_00524 [Pyrenophora tritici-repentis]EDU39695.1 conserved hypothetical protein [Pyrenophora tritici-repentis Pt-1C-BFP]KAF7453241.1 hypothetical protein A1F99_004990 [Pyrenophora tritici-repentis]KAF7576302.1 Pex24p domain containing protein [Pyrenophora tritici-repentis]KAG9377305.1 hypothetical protein A1F94_011708 [Pyrenophora tritici-repentis]